MKINDCNAPVAFDVVLIYLMEFSLRALIRSLSFPISTGCGLNTNSISLNDLPPEHEGPLCSSHSFSVAPWSLGPSAPEPVDSFSDKLVDNFGFFFDEGTDSVGVGVEGALTFGVVVIELAVSFSGAFFLILVALFWDWIFIPSSMEFSRADCEWLLLRLASTLSWCASYSSRLG